MAGAADTPPRAVTIDREEGVAVITLARPERRNALSIQLRMALADAFAEASQDDEVLCVVLTGEGEYFCSGLDRRDLLTSEEGQDPGPLSYSAISDCPKPVLAALNGPALAGGFALALHCDVRIASERAELGFLGHGKGIPPSYAAARAVLAPGVARDLCVTGRVVGAEEALRLGVVSEVTPEEELMARARAIAQEVAASPAPVVLEMKRRFLSEQGASVTPLMREEEEYLLDLLDRVRAMRTAAAQSSEAG